jgi:predicted lipid-binding transport protein (Tim44 family)
MTVAAKELGAGGTAFGVVLLLIIAMALIFWAMIRSFRRLRQSVAAGTFGHPEDPDHPLSAADPAKAEADSKRAKKVTQDQTPGGASV